MVNTMQESLSVNSVLESTVLVFVPTSLIGDVFVGLDPTELVEGVTGVNSGRCSDFRLHPRPYPFGKDPSIHTVDLCNRLECPPGGVYVLSRDNCHPIDSCHHPVGSGGRRGGSLFPGETPATAVKVDRSTDVVRHAKLLDRLPLMVKCGSLDQFGWFRSGGGRSAEGRVGVGENRVRRGDTLRVWYPVTATAAVEVPSLFTGKTDRVISDLPGLAASACPFPILTEPVGAEPPGDCQVTDDQTREVMRLPSLVPVCWSLLSDPGGNGGGTGFLDRGAIFPASVIPGSGHSVGGTEIPDLRPFLQGLEVAVDLGGDFGLFWGFNFSGSRRQGGSFCQQRRA